MGVTGQDQHWGTLPEFSAEFATAAVERFDKCQERVKKSRRHRRMRRAWMAYYSRSDDTGNDDTEINAAGDRGEILLLKTARWRRLVLDQVGQVMQTRPDYEPQALNSDPESQQQAALTLGILDWYRRTFHLESLRKERVECTAVLTEAVQHVRWDEGKGRELDTKDLASDPQRFATAIAQPGVPVYEGDFMFSVRTPYEYALDPTSPDKRRPRWAIVKEPESRWDMLATYGKDSPEIERAIRNAEPWSALLRAIDYEKDDFDHDDSISVMHVYIEPCKAVPAGRHALVLDAQTVLLDGPLGEERSGVFPQRAAEVIFKNEGHSSNLPGLAIAEAHAATISTILSNVDAWGLQRLLTARSANLKDHDVSAGLTRLYWDHKDPKSDTPVPEPKMLNPVEIPSHVFSLESMLRGELDTTMGGSPVRRGDPDATKGDSGSKAAMLFSAATAVGDPFVSDSLRVDEEIATFMINSLKRHATTKRLTTLVGRRNTYAVKEYVGSDLSQIGRVGVRQADASRDTFSGRMNMAELLKDLPPDQREQMQAVVYTGKLEPMTDDLETMRMLLERENDALRDATKSEPPVDKWEQHLEHLHKHMVVKADPAVRQDPALSKRADDHCQWHLDCLTKGSARYAGDVVLLVTGQKPLPPEALTNSMPADGGGEPAQDANAAPPVPPGGKPAGGASDAGEPGAEAPKPPQMPKVPTTGERLPLAAPGAQPPAGG